MSDCRNSCGVIVTRFLWALHRGIASSRIRHQRYPPFFPPPVMDPPFEHARHLFCPPVRAPWRWTDGGKVITWQDGTTVAFAEELTAIFKHCGPRRLPVFPVIVYLLAACRGRFLDDTPSVQAAQGRVREELLAAGRQLRKLAALPADLRQSPEARAEMALMIVEHEPKRLLATGLVENWEKWLQGGATDRVGPEQADYAPFQLRQMSSGLAAISEQILRLRLETGLPALPQPALLPEAAKVPPPAAEESSPVPLRDLLQQLEKDAEFRGIAQMARRVLAALALPGRRTVQEDLPAGGVSDVANRGTPERLLLTELAHEPDVMAARLVLGEALYLRREPPAVQNNPPPLVLIDTSLRLWGLPRVFAAACGLAILAARHGGQRAAVWRSVEGRPRCQPLQRRADVAELLGRVEPELDPLPVLRRWLDAVKTESPESERCFITHSAQLRNAAFRQALRDLPAMLFATVDRDGAFSLHRHAPGRGLQLLCQATLPLESLFEETPAAGIRAVKGETGTARRPLFFSQRERPLLFSPSGSCLWAMPWREDGGIAVVETGHVVSWQQPLKGCRILYHAPEAKAAWGLHRLDRDRFALFLSGERGRRELIRIVILNADRNCVEENWIAGPFAEWEAITASGAVAYIVGLHRTRAVSLETGTLLGTIEHGWSRQEVSPHGFAGTENRFLLGWSGSRITVTENPLPAAGIQAAFWSEDAGAMIAFDRRQGLRVAGIQLRSGNQGWVFDQFIKTLAEGARLIPGPLGKRVMLDSGTARHIYEVTAQKEPAVSLHLRQVISRALPGAVMFRRTGAMDAPSVPFTRHLSAAAFSPSGKLGVRAQRSGTWRWLEFRPRPLWRRGEQLPPESESIRRFHEARLEGVDREVSAADWPKLRLWLDSEGLLHLVSSDPGLPEITLTLSDPSIAWWMSDGEAGGREFFLPQAVSPPVESIKLLEDALSRIATLACHA